MLSRIPHVLVMISFLLTATISYAQEKLDVVELILSDREIIQPQRFNDNEINISIDGKIDEAAWQDLKIHSNFLVTKPDTMQPSRHRTDVRIFYTEKGLYISMDMEQPENSLLRRYTARDDWHTKRDQVSIAIDTSGNARYGYWMALALGDNQGDGTLLPEKIYSDDWDGAWYGGTSLTSDGWSAEYFIPWSQMTMPQLNGTRQVNFYTHRNIGYIDEESSWPPLPESIPQYMSLFQPLLLQDVNPMQQWSVFPYISSTQDNIDETLSHRGGVDLFWRPASNFQLTATMNPDFGSVESDNVVINLTANETYFPEKRLFFQEGNEIFNATPRAGHYGGRNRFTVLNTRRVGGRPDTPDLPDEVSIGKKEKTKMAELVGAAKTTGQVGKFRYGLLASSEEDTSFRADDDNIYTQIGRDFGAFRLLYEDNTGGAIKGIGMLSTLVTKPQSDSVVHAVDFHYLSKNGKWKTDGQIIQSDTFEKNKGNGSYVDTSYTPKKGLKHSLKITSFDDSLDVNDFGYTQRSNIKDIQYGSEFIKSNLKRFRDLKVTTWLRRGENSDGYRVAGGFGSHLFLQFNNLHRLSANFSQFPKRFEDRNSFGNGTFQVSTRNRFEIGYDTNKSKKLSLEFDLKHQEENLEGYKRSSEIGLKWIPKSNINLQLKAEYETSNGWLLHQENRNFTSFTSKKWQPKLNFSYFPNATQQLNIVFQWVGIKAIEDKFYSLPTDSNNLVEIAKPSEETDSFSISQLNIQFRYRWQIAPLSDLYLVMTKSSSDTNNMTSFKSLFENSWDNPVGDQIVLKVRYRLGS